MPGERVLEDEEEDLRRGAALRGAAFLAAFRGAVFFFRAGAFFIIPL